MCVGSPCHSTAQYKALCRVLDSNTCEAERSLGSAERTIQRQSLEQSVANASITCAAEDGGMSEKVPIMFQDMLAALKEVRPSAMREVILEVPKVRCVYIIM